MDGHGFLIIDRNARIFTAGPERTRDLAAQATVHRLMAGQVFTPDTPCDLVMRQGSLRIRETLPDGRQVTRAVLQTGMLCALRTPTAADEALADHALKLERCGLIALGDSEVWVLPSGVVKNG